MISTTQVFIRWGESIFQQIYRIPELSLSYEPKLGETHKQIASARRGNLYYKVLDIYNSIEDINMFPKPEFHPILFEEVYIKDALGQDVIRFIFEISLLTISLEKYRSSDE